MSANKSRTECLRGFAGEESGEDAVAGNRRGLAWTAAASPAILQPRPMINMSRIGGGEAMRRRVVLADLTCGFFVGGALLIAWSATAEVPIPSGAGKPSEFSTLGVSAKSPDCEILGPMTSGGHAVPLDPPTPDEVFRALATSKLSNGVSPPVGGQPRNVRLVLERVADYVDDVRVFPLLGPMQMHHARYKCTIFSNEPTDKEVRSRRPDVNQHVRQLLYIDHKHLHQVRHPDDVAR